MHLTTQQLIEMGYVMVPDPCNPGTATWMKSKTTQQTHAKPPQSDSVVVADTKTPKRIRQSSKPLLNKLEGEWLEQLKLQFCPDLISSQSTRFMLANGIWYKPDFVVWAAHRTFAYEVKGPFAFRGGFENLKVAARVCPYIEWILVWKENGTWCQQRVLP